VTEPAPAQPPATRRIKVWDAPTRIVHWAVVILFGLAWWAQQGDKMALHVVFGCILLAVLLFRLAWGVWGGETARFATFVRSPAAVLGYGRALFAKRKAASATVGHNPMGGWSVAAMLGLLVALTGLGLFCADEDDIAPGPLAKFVSFDAGQFAAHWHGLIFYALLGLIGLHLAAIAFYGLVRRENLVGPMLTGFRRFSGSPAEPRIASPGRAVLLAVAAAAVVGLLAFAGEAPWAAWLGRAGRLVP
jgi:cytochrome b